jgi:hypothetical protein
VLTNVKTADTSTKILGQKMERPDFQRDDRDAKMEHPDGEEGYCEEM